MIVEYIVYAAALCLSMLGLAELIHMIKTGLASSGKKASTYSVVFLSGGSPERQIEFAARQRLWLGKAYSDYIIAVNTGIDAESDRECRCAAEKYGVEYLTPDELSERIVSYISVHGGSD